MKHLHVRRKLYKFSAPPKCCSFPADLRTEKTQAFFFATSSLQCAHPLVYRNNITQSIAKTSPDHIPAYSELRKEKPSKDGLVFLHLFGCKENRGRGSINSITNSQCRPNLVSETRKCPLIFNASTQSETSCADAYKLEHPGMLPYYMGPIRKCPAHPPCGCETKNDYDKFLLETLLIPRSQTVLIEGPSNQTQWREKNCVKNKQSAVTPFLHFPTRKKEKEIAPVNCGLACCIEGKLLESEMACEKKVIDSFGQQ